ncbi:hypothetical protein GCM10010406_02610 [Streptomyces thermolineatus]|uniref:Phosphatidylglycerophosphate synthase n=1 Tax=Streptomyces thermolineatus TaxID=44033 RepID=A0ABN3KS47_9ACTN
MDIPPLAEVRKRTEKKRDAWWTVLLVDPVATPLVRWTAKWTRATPNQITWAALFIGLGAAACFARGDWEWLALGAVLYHVSFILDCMDGKLARLTGKGSVFGAWLDYIFDRVRVLACSVALMGGQYSKTGEVIYVWLALAVVFLDMLRYLDALEIFKVRHNMRKQIRAQVKRARAANSVQGPEGSELAFMEDLLREDPEAEDQTEEQAEEQAGKALVQPGSTVNETLTASTAETSEDGPAEAKPKKKREVVDLHVEFKSRFPWYGRIRSFFLRHRIRTHLVSGIEFQMAVFIIGPLVGAIIPVTIGAGVLLFLFELAIIYKLLLSTRDFGRTMAAFQIPETAVQIPPQQTQDPAAESTTKVS